MVSADSHCAAAQASQAESASNLEASIADTGDRLSWGRRQTQINGEGRVSFMTNDRALAETTFPMQ
jgi:hypothetical protein